jgi:hypothetical protein
MAGIALASYARGSALSSLLPMRGALNAGHRCYEDWLMLLAKGVIMTGFVAVVLAPLHLSAECTAHRQGTVGREMEGRAACRQLQSSARQAGTQAAAR